MKTQLYIALITGGLVWGTHAQYAFVTGANPAPAQAVNPAPPPNPVPAAPPIQVNTTVYAGCAHRSALPRHPVYFAPPGMVPASTVSYSVLGHSYDPSCATPPVIYHVPAPNVVYFGRPESRFRNYLNRSYPPNPSSVIYFGRGEAVQRGYYFNRCR